MFRSNNTVYGVKRILALTLVICMVFSPIFGESAIWADDRQNPVTEKNYVITNPYEDVNWNTDGQYKAAHHTHSTYSDGSNLRKDMLIDTYNKGFDIVAMTDHDYTTIDWITGMSAANGGWNDMKRSPLIDDASLITAINNGSYSKTNPSKGTYSGNRTHDNGMIGMGKSNEVTSQGEPAGSISGANFSNHHINAFWADLPSNAGSGKTMAQVLETIENAGGISHINHPGRYTGGQNNAAQSSNADIAIKYADLFEDYESCVGIEIVNKWDGESVNDKILWDSILTKTMPDGRFVWGFSNDDSHSLSGNGHAWNVMLLSDLTQPKTRESMENGSFYCVSRIDRKYNVNHDLGGNTPGAPAQTTTNETMYSGGANNSMALDLLTQTTPEITSIATSGFELSITGTAINTIDWVADGEVIYTGETLNLTGHELGQKFDTDKDINYYVRAVCVGNNGVAYTQPFLLQYDSSDAIDGIVNPYESVIWDGAGKYGQYKAANHTHSTYSDGSNLRKDMLLDKYAKDFDIVAMTDHDYTTTDWVTGECAANGGWNDMKTSPLIDDETLIDAINNGNYNSSGFQGQYSGTRQQANGMIGMGKSNEVTSQGEPAGSISGANFSNHHINAFWADLPSNVGSGKTMAQVLEAIENAGGISHINHPGRYTGGQNNAAQSSNAAITDKYVKLYEDYESCLGIEIVNKWDGESVNDKILWDSILMKTMPKGRSVWGFSNDDSHSLSGNGHAWNVMLLSDLTQSKTRESMEKGAFYGVSRIDRKYNVNHALDGNTPGAPAQTTTNETMYSGGSNNSMALALLGETTPSISKVTVTQGTGASITISGAAFNKVDWVADGEVIHTGETIDLNDYQDKINSYVRAVCVGSYGVAYTQPFGIQEIKNYTISNPYKNVSWNSDGQYKVANHTHSTYSDGSNFRRDMLIDTYNKGFDVVAMTDHDVLTKGWDKDPTPATGDWNNIGTANLSTTEAAAIMNGTYDGSSFPGKYKGVRPQSNGMIGMGGSNEITATNEASTPGSFSAHHINAFWADYETGSVASGERTMANILAKVEALGGITHINHPGRYTGAQNDASLSKDPAIVKRYVDLYMDYKSCVGIEIVNKLDGESINDKILWDSILKETMPEGRTVWGFSNDDSHSLTGNGNAWNVMLMPALSESGTRTSMESGAFYAVSRIDRKYGINDTKQGGGAMPGAPAQTTTTADMYSGGTDDNLRYLLEQPTPKITNIEVTQGETASITISGSAFSRVEWIADGEVIYTGETIHLNDHQQEINSYVRAVCIGDTGVAYTQPFGISGKEYDFSKTLMSLARTSPTAAAEEGNLFSADSGIFKSVSNLTAWNNNEKIVIGTSGTARTPIVINNAAPNNNSAPNSDAGFRSVSSADVDAGITQNTATAYQIKFRTTGYKDIEFSCSQKSTATGPDAFALAYSIGSPTGPYTVIPDSKKIVPKDTFTDTYSDLRPTYQNFKLPAAVANKPDVYLRLYMVDHSNLSGTRGGNTSINDICIVGNVGSAFAGFDAEMLTLTPGKSTSEINVTWHDSSKNGTLGKVKFAPKAAMTGNEFPADAAIMNATSGNAYTGKTSFKAVLTELAADTEYIYAVSSDGVNYSKHYSYKTPAAGDFTFAAIGDSQLTDQEVSPETEGVPPGMMEKNHNKTTKLGWQETVDAILNDIPDVGFIASTGDQIDRNLTAGAPEGLLDQHQPKYANFMAPDALRSVPYAPAVGNHDARSNYTFVHHFNLPNETVLTGTNQINTNSNTSRKDIENRGNYYYLYNNALFVVLNTSAQPNAAGQAHKDMAKEIVSVFENVLEEATDEYKGQYDWLFVQHHKTTAGLADHAADIDVQNYTEAGFEKLMLSYGVDVVFAGHDHIYARSYPVEESDKSGNINGVTFNRNKSGDINKGDGTVFLSLNSSSGQKFYEEFVPGVADNASYPYLADGTRGSVELMKGKALTGDAQKGKLPWSVNKYHQNYKPMFMGIEVTESNIKINAYEVQDDQTTTIIDTFEIKDASANKAAADIVIALIDALPTNAQLTDKAAVEAARKAYDALTSVQKALVTNYSKLVTAELSIANQNKSKTVTGLSLNAASKTLIFGQKFTLIASVTPSDAAEKVSYASSNPKIAQVNGSGVVTAKGVGRAVITVTAGTQIKSCSITVKPKTLTKPKKLKITAKKAKWKSVTNNNGYQLKIIENGKVIKTVSIKKGARSYAFKKGQFVKGKNYSFSIKAKGKGNYSNSKTAKSKIFKMK